MKEVEKLNERFKNMPLNVFISDVIGMLDKGLTLGFFGTSGEKLEKTRKDVVELFYLYSLLNKDMFGCKRCGNCKHDESQDIFMEIKSFALVNSYYISLSRYMKEKFNLDLSLFSFMEHYISVSFKKDAPLDFINDWYQSIIVFLSKYPVENDILLEELEEKSNNGLFDTIIGSN